MTTLRKACGGRYRFLPAALFAASACFFAWSAEVLLDTFCVAFLFTDLGDLSPIIISRFVLWFARLRNVRFSEAERDLVGASGASQIWKS